MDKVLWVGAGGFLGSILRYVTGGLVQCSVGGSTFPWGTMAVNALGCYVIGLVSQLVESQGALSPAARAFFVVGVLGGFTTFSAFGHETVNLVRDSQRMAATMNVGGHIVIAIGAVWLGRLTAQWIWR